MVPALPEMFHLLETANKEAARLMDQMSGIQVALDSALAERNKLRTEGTQRQEEVESLKEELSHLRAFTDERKEMLTNELERAFQEREEAENSVTAALFEKEEALKDVATLEKELAPLQAELEALRNASAASDASIRVELAQAKRERAQAKREADALRAQDEEKEGPNETRPHTSHNGNESIRHSDDIRASACILSLGPDPNLD